MDPRAHPLAQAHHAAVSQAQAHQAAVMQQQAHQAAVMQHSGMAAMAHPGMMMAHPSMQPHGYAHMMQQSMAMATPWGLPMWSVPGYAPPLLSPRPTQRPAPAPTGRAGWRRLARPFGAPRFTVWRQCARGAGWLTPYASYVPVLRPTFPCCVLRARAHGRPGVPPYGYPGMGGAMIMMDQDPQASHRPRRGQ